jgi:peptidoglycan/LPS O-acetylase OafA/YrhL
MDFDERTLFGVEVIGSGYLILCLISGLIPLSVLFTERLVGIGWMASAVYGWLLIFLDGLAKRNQFTFYHLDAFLVFAGSMALFHVLFQKRYHIVPRHSVLVLLALLSLIGLLVLAQNYGVSRETALLAGGPGIAGLIGLVAYTLKKRRVDN